MRKLIALFALLALCGCGGTRQKKRSSPAPVPPPMLFVAEEGTHVLDPGSSCVSSDGHSVCGDSAYIPVKVLYPVRRGETVHLELAAATHGASLTIGRPGCPSVELANVRLEPPKLAWHVELPRGDYEVRALVDHFATKDGRSGDVSGQIGIAVGAVDAKPAAAKYC